MEPTGGNSGGKFSLWSVLVIAAAVASAAAGAGWQVGRSGMEDELEQYRRSIDLGLPETLTAMRDLSGKLKVSLEEKKQLEAIPNLRTQNARLRSQLTASTQALGEARKALAETEGDTFSLTSRKTRVIVPGRLAVGVDNVISNACSVRLGKESDLLSPGEFIETIEGGMNYRVLLLEVKDSVSCKFSLSGKAAES